MKKFPYNFINKLNLMSDKCYCLRGGIAQCVQYTATNIDLLCVPIWVLIIPDSSTRALRKSPADI
jgi:hypothetical protein